LDVLNKRLHLFEPSCALTAEATARQAKLKRFFKESVYNRIPFGFSAFAYFLYRYFIQLGFLDGAKVLSTTSCKGFGTGFWRGQKFAN